MKNQISEETKTIDPDFPIYDDNPKIETWGIILFAAAVIWTTVSIFAEIEYPGYSGPVIFCAIPLAAYLIVARGKMTLIVKKFKAMDFVRTKVTLILQLVFTIGVTFARRVYFNAEPTAISQKAVSQVCVAVHKEVSIDDRKA